MDLIDGLLDACEIIPDNQYQIIKIRVYRIDGKNIKLPFFSVFNFSLKISLDLAPLQFRTYILLYAYRTNTGLYSLKHLVEIVIVMAF